MSTISDLPLKILVVDDERPIRRFLNASLGSRYTIFEAGNGEEAIQAAALNHPDVIILDLGLPDMDGTDVTRRLKKYFHYFVPYAKSSGRTIGIHDK